MSREFDRRTASGRRAAPARDALLGGASAEDGTARPAAVEIPIDSIAPAGAVGALGGAPVPEQGSRIQRALEYARGMAGAAGLEAAPPLELNSDPNVQRTSSGAAAVHLQQLHKGVPIFQANQVVQFDPGGAIEGSVGQAVSVTDDESSPTPLVRPEQALLIAARFLAETAEPQDVPERDQFGEPLSAAPLRLAGYTPKISAAFPDKADAPTVFEQGPFGTAPKASLVWFVLDGQLHLAWEAMLTMPDLAGRYRLIVDAMDGELLYCHETAHFAAARGVVHAVDGASARRKVDFPLPPASYGLPIPPNLPAGFPADWVDEDSADGNNVYAHLGDADLTIGGALVSGVVEFEPANPLGNAQRILNAFYFVNRAHDYFYLLGFREADGNFQRRNLLAGGRPGDAIDARVYDGFVNGTASMLTLVDGANPILRLGLMGSTGRHTALDSSVVYHEYAHGVTNRLIGGPLNGRALDAVQSQALGEALSDFFACTMNRTTVIGAWVRRDPGGIRTAPYDSGYPAHFGMLGQAPFDRIHAAGEIYCAALMELSRAIGAELCAQLVMDALRLTPANPTFLQARDAVLRAIDHKLAAGALGASEHQAMREAAWRAFTRFGMGPGAQALSAHVLGQVVADTGAPQPAALEADDLKQIAGIENGIERKLQAAGIRTFRQLAETSPARLARIIARSGLTAAVITEHGWVEQARELADERERLAALGADEPVEDDRGSKAAVGPGLMGHTTEHFERQRPTSFTVRLNLGSENTVYKTEVVHAPDGEHDHWAGWNERRLIDFIKRYAGIEELAPAPATQRLDSDHVEQPAPVEAQASQRDRGGSAGFAPGAEEPGGQERGRELAITGATLEGETVDRSSGDDQVRLRLSFEAGGVLDGPDYIWEIAATNTATGERSVLATEHGALRPHTPEQELLAVVSLPLFGQYRLSCTLLIPEHHMFIQASGPRLTVEPRS